jgi:hypothetical protein
MKRRSTSVSSILSPPTCAPLGPALGERGLHDRGVEIFGRNLAARDGDLGPRSM